MQQPNQRQPNQPQLTLDQATFISCGNCGSQVLQSLSVYMKFSKILAGTPDDVIQPIPVVVCSDCGTIVEELLPKEFIGKIKNQQSENPPQVMGKVPTNSNIILGTDKTDDGKSLIQG